MQTGGLHWNGQGEMQFRLSDLLKEIVFFVCSLNMHKNTWIGWHLKETVLWGNITWLLYNKRKKKQNLKRPVYYFAWVVVGKLFFFGLAVGGQILAQSMKPQPRCQSSLAISDLTSPVKLVRKMRWGHPRAIVLGSKPPPLVTQIGWTGLGTRLMKPQEKASCTGCYLNFTETRNFTFYSLQFWVFLVAETIVGFVPSVLWCGYEIMNLVIAPVCNTKKLVTSQRWQQQALACPKIKYSR